MRPVFNRTFYVSKSCIVISLLLLPLLKPVFADTLRVTTWNLQGATSLPSNPILTNAVEAAAATLKQLDPDVILLQQVRDWRMCSQLVQALKPATYEVLICSAFPETPATARQNRQAAILSKHKAYFSWSQAWSGTSADKTLSGGFVFATIRAGDHRIGLFSVELDGQIFANDSATSNFGVMAHQQWAQQIQSIRKWVTNRPESAIVAGGLSPGGSQWVSRTAKVEQERLVNVFLATALAAEPQQIGERITVRMTSSPDSIPAVVLSRFPQTCDLDLELAEPASLTSSSPVAAAAAESKSADDQFPNAITEFVKPLATESNFQVAEAGSIDSQQVHQVFWLALTPVAILLIAACIWLLAKNENNPARELHANLPLGLENVNPISADSRLIAAQSGKVSSFDELPSSAISAHQLKVWQQRAIVAEQKAQKANEVIRAGLMSYMREWLKQKLFRKLISDRTELLESQHLATMKVLAVDERLSRIEVQIQQQNQAYEQRIEKLTEELAVTREESRALIRAQINQIKGEMEAARARLIAEAESHDVVIT